MYLDDGISRDSAPSHDYVPEASAGSGYGRAHDLVPGLIDPKARSHFCHVKIAQVSTLTVAPPSHFISALTDLTRRQQPA